MIRRAYTAQSQHIILCPEQTSFEVRPYDLGAQSIVCYSRRALGHGHTIAPHNRYTQYDARSRLRGTTIRFRRTINSMPGADELRGTAIRLRRTIVTHNIIPGADELSGTAIRFRRTINSMPGADELRGTAILLRRTTVTPNMMPGAGFEGRPYNLGAHSIVCYSRRASRHGHTIAPHNRYTQYDTRGRRAFRYGHTI